MRAKKSLGQNFLVDKSIVARIVSSVAAHSDEIILEIGPGQGALTALLIEQAGLVIAVEIDDELIELLKAQFAAASNLIIVDADILQVDLLALIAEIYQSNSGLRKPVRVVANLPYYISTAVLFKLIKARALIKDMTLMLQREVVERIISSPGGKEYGVLSVLTQLYCRASLLFHVKPGSFRPIPKVDSSVMRLELLNSPVADVKEEMLFEKVVQAAFAQRRKTIQNSLKANLSKIDNSLSLEQVSNILKSAAIDPERRAETVSCLEFANLTEQFSRLINQA